VLFLGWFVRQLGGFVSNCSGGGREGGRKGGRKYIVMHRYEPFLLELVVMIVGLVCKEIIFPLYVRSGSSCQYSSGNVRAVYMIAKTSSYYNK